MTMWCLGAVLSLVGALTPHRWIAWNSPWDLLRFLLLFIGIGLMLTGSH